MPPLFYMRIYSKSTFAVFLILATSFWPETIGAQPDSKKASLFVSGSKNTAQDTVQLAAWLHQLTAMLKRNPEQIKEPGLELARKADSLAMRSENPFWKARTHQTLGRFYAAIRQYDVAQSNYRRAIALFQQNKDTSNWQRTLYFQGLISFLHGDLELSDSIFSECLRLQLRFNRKSPFKLGLIYNALATIRRQRGQFDAAKQYFKAALQQFDLDQENPPGEKGLVYNNLKNLYENLGRLDSAFYYAHLALDMHKQIKDTNLIILSLVEAGKLRVKLCNEEAAAELAREAQDLVSRSGLQAMNGKVFFLLGEIRKQQRDTANALSWYMQALAASNASGNQKEIWNTTGAIGDIYLGLQRFDSAQVYYAHAKRIASAMNAPTLLMDTYLALAKFEYKRGRLTQAHSYIDSTLYLNDTLQLSRIFSGAYLILADIYEDQRDYERAYHYFKMGKALSDSLLSIKVALTIEEMQSQKMLEEKAKQFSARIDRIQWRTHLAIALIVLLSAVLVYGLIFLRKLHRRMSGQTQRLNQVLEKQSESIRQILRSQPPGKNHNTWQDLGMRFQDALEKIKADYQGPENLTFKSNIALLEHLTQYQQQFNLLLQEQVSVKEQDLRSFNYTVSHDLKAPLATASNLIALFRVRNTLQNATLAEKYLTDLDHMIGDMKQMIEGLSAFAQADNLELQFQTVDVHALVSQIIARIREADPGRAFRFDIGELPSLYGDPLLLRQVFVNLLSNAAKFTRAIPEPLIRVSGRNTNDGFVEITVADNGAGIPPEGMHRVFQLFKTAHDRRQFEGTGAGLAIVKRIVERHKGSIWAESEGRGKGSRFVVRLPLSLPVQ